ncbi:Response regulator receiver modulated metal dependent phosphohydrolase [Candidatus Terasakiella magnetica]|uniref:Response regulator receiver modulated metal dependent phosphohydrolase n=1 Tax=Candidatus Terasakiella magnetica TaxID=1867952 RepID=A0A1C3RIV0_9PROT|nr:HD domain-containing phosphohydrolase [Candidatus Terasakiella magnetica]SCA57196.1 Response regulator receiver modulated metal dependent phosphohydrolase [Candidatus Terasakiella magnetica]
MTDMEKKISECCILVVDDKPVNVLLLEQLLEEEGFDNVISTTDSREVVGLYQSKQIDMILLDIRMPYMDGIEVMGALKEVVGDDDYLPILVLTAQTDIETHKNALAAGARDFLTKPFQPWEVFQRIRNLLETRVFYNNQRVRADVLETEVQKRTKELHETQLEVVRRLGRAGEYRDNETGAHVVRMSKSCKLLALKAGLGEAFAELILQASPMHDVGKIGIPDNILLKPARLSDEERHVMNKHVEIGMDIIGSFDSEMLSMAREIAASHHEKWDGSGYPNQLSGEDIPISGRIAAICDVFDALTSERPYKEAWSTENALSFLQENAASHFDPHLVAVFIEIIPEITSLRLEHPDEEE